MSRQSALLDELSASVRAFATSSAATVTQGWHGVTDAYTQIRIVDDMVHASAVTMILAAAATFLLTLVFTAPYGRHAPRTGRTSWGPLLPARLCWLVQESGVLVALTLVLYHPRHAFASRHALRAHLLSPGGANVLSGAWWYTALDRVLFAFENLPLANQLLLGRF